MRVKEIMTANPRCCTPDTMVTAVAQMMVECDCGEIPVVDDLTSLRPVGVVTDRDITCRVVARGWNPAETYIQDCMTSPVITVKPDTPVEDCCKLMRKHQVRRVPVVDAEGHLCGMIAQADLIKHVPEQTSEVLRKVSQPAQAPSAQA